MKFQVRDGFTCRLQTTIDLGNGQTEVCENPTHPGQIIELSSDQAAGHAHQLEPLDDEASAWMQARHLKVTEPAPPGLSPEQLQTLAQLLTQQLVGVVGRVNAPASEA
jgi:hypothetical protein